MILLTLLTIGAAPLDPIAAGPFEPTWDSLQQYECPAWYRDAKFGIWAHWSPQCVPGDGDWYARGMYQEGGPQYQYHLAHFGHPSIFGYKDICNLWHAERWDPEALLRLYRRAGAQYFVALANHHCNFDGWNSKHHAWNSVNVGPKRDLIGDWAAAARRHGLPFGVTVHSARAWDWFQVAHGADQQGSRAGVPYDGRLTAADGRGQWWDGLDPQQLYCPAHAEGEPPSREYVVNWFRRTKDLLDSYQPDLLYFDDHMLPLGEAGMAIAAHFYNSNAARHGGRCEAVLNTKGMPPELRGTLVWDIERGLSEQLEPYPWQTDTCIGQWHYKEGAAYKSVSQVVHMLVDIVSKNGNLLLNIPVRGDGSIDEREVAFLEGMADWWRVCGDAVVGSRPWVVFGEGPTRARGGQFNEGQGTWHDPADLRFVTKGGKLYAFALAWPDDGRLVIRSLARLAGVTGRVRGVRLLGARASLRFEHGAEGLSIELPGRRPCDHVWALEIDVTDLDGFRPHDAPQAAPRPIRADRNGVLTLSAERAEVHGDRLRLEQRGERPNLGFWDNAADSASWTIEVTAAGTYRVEAEVAAAGGPSAIAVDIAGQRLAATVAATGSWDSYARLELGSVDLGAGQWRLSMAPADAAAWRAVNLRAVRLIQAAEARQPVHRRR